MITRTLSDAFWGLALMWALGAGAVTAWIVVGGIVQWWRAKRRTREAIERVIGEGVVR